MLLSCWELPDGAKCNAASRWASSTGLCAVPCGPGILWVVVAPMLVVVVPYFLLSLLVSRLGNPGRRSPLTTSQEATRADDGPSSIAFPSFLPRTNPSRSSLLASVGVAAADISSSSSATRQ
jgi:hypothetical protein